MMFSLLWFLADLCYCFADHFLIVLFLWMQGRYIRMCYWHVAEWEFRWRNVQNVFAY